MNVWVNAKLGGTFTNLFFIRNLDSKPFFVRPKPDSPISNRSTRTRSIICGKNLEKKWMRLLEIFDHKSQN